MQKIIVCATLALMLGGCLADGTSESAEEGALQPEPSAESKGAQSLGTASDLTTVDSQAVAIPAPVYVTCALAVPGDASSGCSSATAGQPCKKSDNTDGTCTSGY